MKSYDFAIQIKPLQQWFHVVLFAFPVFTKWNLKFLSILILAIIFIVTRFNIGLIYNFIIPRAQIDSESIAHEAIDVGPFTFKHNIHAITYPSGYTIAVRSRFGA